ncbi:MAG: ABC transporter ATP-binding protein [Dehalococcoidales bacterium]|nr:ABC transporter ATP-binding protein [Dehalococcoidales bacterium]
MTEQYAIEIKNLVKRYPTNARQEGPRGGGPGGGQGIQSFGGILNVLRGRKRSYIEALRGIDLQVRKGEVFGLLGTNGAGKTTLIKILSTLVIHDEGEVFVNGLDIKNKPRQVVQNLQAVLPESRGFNWRLTGKQNLAFYALLYGIDDKEARERVNYLLELTGLKDRANDSYQRYSTGMQRRLLLCRALLRDTPILLFDEPTVGLDPTAAADFRSLVRNKLSREEGTTIFLSTHNLHEAQETCDRVAILERGKILACDSPEKIRNLFIEEKMLHVTFDETVYSEEQEKALLALLERTEGVNGVTPGIDDKRLLHTLSIRVDKDISLSGIIDILIRNDLRILTISTSEPSLENAFMKITRQYRE